MFAKYCLSVLYVLLLVEACKTSHHGSDTSAASSGDQALTPNETIFVSKSFDSNPHVKSLAIYLMLDKVNAEPTDQGGGVKLFGGLVVGARSMALLGAIRQSFQSFKGSLRSVHTTSEASAPGGMFAVDASDAVSKGIEDSILPTLRARTGDISQQVASGTVKKTADTIGKDIFEIGSLVHTSDRELLSLHETSGVIESFIGASEATGLFFGKATTTWAAASFANAFDATVKHLLADAQAAGAKNAAEQFIQEEAALSKLANQTVDRTLKEFPGTAAGFTINAMTECMPIAVASKQFINKMADIKRTNPATYEVMKDTYAEVIGRMFSFDEKSTLEAEAIELRESFERAFNGMSEAQRSAFTKEVAGPKGDPSKVTAEEAFRHVNEASSSIGSAIVSGVILTYLIKAAYKALKEAPPQDLLSTLKAVDQDFAEFHSVEGRVMTADEEVVFEKQGEKIRDNVVQAYGVLRQAVETKVKEIFDGFVSLDHAPTAAERQKLSSAYNVLESFPDGSLSYNGSRVVLAE